MRISDWSSDVCSSDLGCCLFLACPFFIETQIVVARRGGREGTGHASFIPQIGGQVAGAYRKQETVERNVPAPGARSEGRRVGKECVSTGSARWSRNH